MIKILLMLCLATKGSVHSSAHCSFLFPLKRLAGLLASLFSPLLLSLEAGLLLPLPRLPIPCHEMKTLFVSLVCMASLPLTRLGDPRVCHSPSSAYHLNDTTLNK